MPMASRLVSEENTQLFNVFSGLGDPLLREGIEVVEVEHLVDFLEGVKNSHSVLSFELGLVADGALHQIHPLVEGLFHSFLLDRASEGTPRRGLPSRIASAVAFEG